MKWHYAQKKDDGDLGVPLCKRVPSFANRTNARADVTCQNCLKLIRAISLGAALDDEVDSGFQLGTSGMKGCV